MDALLAFVMTTAGLVAAGALFIIALGCYFLWRSRRKLRQTT
jgi:hypothetical protein